MNISKIQEMDNLIHNPGIQIYSDNTELKDLDVGRELGFKYILTHKGREYLYVLPCTVVMIDCRKSAAVFWTKYMLKIGESFVFRYGDANLYRQSLVRQILNEQMVYRFSHNADFANRLLKMEFDSNLHLADFFVLPSLEFLNVDNWYRNGPIFNSKCRYRFYADERSAFNDPIDKMRYGKRFMPIFQKEDQARYGSYWTSSEIDGYENSLVGCIRYDGEDYFSTADKYDNYNGVCPLFMLRL